MQVTQSGDTSCSIWQLVRELCPLQSPIQEVFRPLKNSPRKRGFGMNKSRPYKYGFRVNEKEKEIIERKIAESGKSKQDFFLRSVLDKKIYKTEDVYALYIETKRIGNNLNQLTKALNSKNYCDFELLQKNQKELDELWRSLRQFLAELR